MIIEMIYSNNNVDEHKTPLYKPMIVQGNDKHPITILLARPDLGLNPQLEEESRAYMNGLSDMLKVMGNNLTGTRIRFKWIKK